MGWDTNSLSILHFDYDNDNSRWLPSALDVSKHFARNDLNCLYEDEKESERFVNETERLMGGTKRFQNETKRFCNGEKKFWEQKIFEV